MRLKIIKLASGRGHDNQPRGENLPCQIFEHQQRLSSFDLRKTKCAAMFREPSPFRKCTNSPLIPNVIVYWSFVLIVEEELWKNKASSLPLDLAEMTKGSIN